MCVEERQDRRVAADFVLLLDEAVVFVGKDDVLGRDAVLLCGLDDLVGLDLQHARVVGALPRPRATRPLSATLALAASLA